MSGNSEDEFWERNDSEHSVTSVRRSCQGALHDCIKNVQLFTRVQHTWRRSQASGILLAWVPWLLRTDSTLFLNARGLGTVGEHSLRTMGSLGCWWYASKRHNDETFMFPPCEWHLSNKVAFSRGWKISTLIWATLGKHSNQASSVAERAWGRLTQSPLGKTLPGLHSWSLFNQLNTALYQVPPCSK